MAVRTRNVQEIEKKDLLFVEGATVRKSVAAPKRIVEEPVKREWEREEEARQERRRKNRIRREQERALSYSRAYVTFLSACICVMFLVCGCYLYLQASMSEHLSTISMMQNQIIDLKSDNDETMQRISSALDLEVVKDRAMNELGMIYPRSTQIIYYNMDESDTMTQYAEVP